MKCQVFMRDEPNDDALVGTFEFPDAPVIGDKLALAPGNHVGDIIDLWYAVDPGHDGSCASAVLIVSKPS